MVLGNVTLRYHCWIIIKPNPGGYFVQNCEIFRWKTSRLGKVCRRYKDPMMQRLIFGCLGYFNMNYCTCVISTVDTQIRYMGL
jgi:hypothetical protein